jgi:hypothetical protein
VKLRPDRDPPAPAHWVRVQALVCDSGLPAALAMMTGDPAASPWQLAKAEERTLHAAGARVLHDLTGRPCVDLADSAVTAWLAGLDARVIELSAAIERNMEAAQHG